MTHNFDRTDRRTENRFEGAPDVPFTVKGTRADKTGFQPGLGLQFDVNEQFSGSLQWTELFRDDLRNTSFQGNINYVF